MRAALQNAIHPRRSAPAAAAGNGRPDVDGNDLLVWYDWEGGSWASVGSNALAVNDSAGTITPYPGLGVFGDGIAVPSKIATGSGGGLLRTAGTTVGELQTFSASTWVYITLLPGVGESAALLVKQAATGAWSSPYSAWGLYALPDGSVVAGITGTMSTTTIQTDPDLLGPGWHHIGLTVDGDADEAKLYVDGDQQVTATMTDPIAYASHGPYVLGGLPIGGGAAYCGGYIGEVRIADVVRNAAYFAAVWASRRTP